MPDQTQPLYVNVIVPVALPKPYTYAVPAALQDRIRYGIRVEVQFGKSKRYAAVVVSTGEEAPEYRTKSVIGIIDEEPVITPLQYRFWQWMAMYYCCTIGEVMHAALPAGMKLSSETRVYLLREAEDDEMEQLPDRAVTILEALAHEQERDLDELRKISGTQSVLPLIHQLFRLGLIAVKEELVDTYKPKIEKYVRLAGPFAMNQENLHEAMDLVKRSEKQMQALLHLVRMSRNSDGDILRRTLTDTAGVDTAVIRALERKGIVTIIEREVNRVPLEYGESEATINLNPDQERSCDEIREIWASKPVVLLHGVTGSGKTWIYKKLLREAHGRGEQTLYLLPEIALTVQVVQRLRRIFGDRIVIAHSALSNNERVDLWKRVQEGAPFVLGVRSSIFLPFQNLGLIVIDEEHDSSFKQADPAPRYHGRDAAIYLATLCGARVLLGSATPSIESYYNAHNGKYGLVDLRARYQDVRMPDIRLIDLRKHRLSTSSQFSQILIDAMAQALEHKEQIIIFKNRRGFAPVVRCRTCGWQAMCDQCDISLTYHKFSNHMHCHLCGTQKPVPATCPACGDSDIILEGYGTQKIEDELKAIFPDARIARMDYDNTRSRFSYQKIIDDFENGRIDILVGTQMVTKGLDFDHVGLVGVVHADQQLYFPHFRAVERTFQLLVQVSGRAGRKETPGNVIVQTYNPSHAVFADVGLNDYLSFYNREVAERQSWGYPPFTHLIKVTVKHRDRATTRHAAIALGQKLRQRIGRGVLGPAEPRIGKVRNLYLMNLGIKMARISGRSTAVKQILLEEIQHIRREKGMTTVRITVDVDPA